MMPVDQCGFDGCDRPWRSRNAGYCEGHYYQRRRGRPMSPLMPRYGSAPCAVDGCTKPRTGRYCDMHKARIQRHGDPNVCITPQDRIYPRGENHHWWTTEPSYAAVHIRLRNQRGAASTYACGCGAPARQWAFTGPRRPGQRVPHESDIWRYKPMCVPCHKRMDLERIGTTRHIYEADGMYWRCGLPRANHVHGAGAA